MDPISRAEIAAIVILALGQEDQSKTTGAGQQAFTDSSQASWAAGYLGVGKQLGLMTGYEDGSFRPNNLSTRAERPWSAGCWESCKRINHMKESVSCL